MNIFKNISLSDVEKILISPDEILDRKKYQNFNSFLKKEKKKLFFIFFDNTKEALIIYFLLIKNNHLVLLLPEDLKNENVNKLIINYSPNYIILEKKNFFEKKNLSEEVILDKYKVLKNINSEKYKIRENLALLLNTSGSTGSPKLVKITHENLYHNTVSICKIFNITNKHKTITTLKPYYTYGLSIINTHIFKKAKIVINNKTFFDKKFWIELNKQRINSFGAVSTMYSFLQKLKFEKFQIPFIKYITHAGARLDNDLHSYINNVCNRKKIKFITMYGQTEATSRISYLPWKYSNLKLGSIGIPIPGGKMFFKKNNKGEILYRGKNIMGGYSMSYKDLDKIKNIQTLKTGDFGYIDEDGFFYISGRKDRFVKIYGERINLDDLDNFLIRKGIETATILKNNKLLITFTKPNQKDKIREILKDNFRLNSNIFNYKFKKKLPYTKNGKVKYSAL